MDEMRAQSTTNSAGGYTVAPAFYKRADRGRESLRRHGDVSRRRSRPTPARRLADADGERDQRKKARSSPKTSSSGNQDITFGVVNIGAFKFSSKLVLVSRELLQDSAFNIMEYIAKALGDRTGRIKNKKYTIGVGTTEPKGLIPAATLGKTGLTGQTLSVISTI
jgi:HK97 family phage major capsid protein